MESGPRKISTLYNPKTTQHNTTQQNKIAQSEIANHAEPTCFGSNFTAIHFTGAHFEVSPFSEQYTNMTNIPVATTATAWDDPNSGETTILLFHQGLGLAMPLLTASYKPQPVQDARHTAM